jgi:hypothetical protein
MDLSETFDDMAARLIYLNNWLFILILALIAIMVYYKTKDWKR